MCVCLDVRISNEWGRQKCILAVDGVSVFWNKAIVDTASFFYYPFQVPFALRIMPFGMIQTLIPAVAQFLVCIGIL